MGQCISSSRMASGPPSLSGSCHQSLFSFAAGRLPVGELSLFLWDTPVTCLSGKRGWSHFGRGAAGLRELAVVLTKWPVSRTWESMLCRLGEQEVLGFCRSLGLPLAMAVWEHHTRETSCPWKSPRATPLHTSF